MAKQCVECDQAYPDFVDFCVADGRRLERVIHTHDPDDTLPVRGIEESANRGAVSADDEDDGEDDGN